MNRIFRFAPAVALAAAVVSPKAASAQTYTTYPIGPYSQTVFFLGIGAGNWAAASFVYTDPAASLASLDVGFEEIFIQGFTTPLNITFLTGNTMQAATTIESWQVPVIPNSPLGSYSFNSLLNPTLVTGQRYWVELSTVGYGWNWYSGSNVINAITSQSNNGGATWVDSGPGGSPAFAVFTNPPGTTLATVPEPATMTLMAFGLASMAAVRRRKRAR